MSKFGHLQEFHSGAESVTTYLERMELSFTTNEIADEKKVTVFISSVGSTMYPLLQDLVVPAKPADKTLEELFKLLKDHYNPTPLVIAKCYNFHSLAQRATESVSCRIRS